MNKVPTQKRSRARVELILKVSRQILMETGVEGVTTSNIAKRAGIPVGSVYQYFSDKQSILEAVVSNYFDEVKRALEQFAAAEDEVVDVPWQEQTGRFVRGLDALTMRSEFSIALNQVFTKYPVLADMDREHGEWIAESLAIRLRQLGSNWPKPKLKRLAHFLYSLECACWAYQADHSPPKREVEAWSELVYMATVQQCMPIEP